MMISSARKHRTYPQLFIAVLLLLFSVMLNGQSYMLSLNNLEEGKQIGHCELNSQVISSTVTTVEYSFAKTVLPNPFAGKYTYEIRRNASGFSIDMFAMLPDLDTRIDNKIQVDYTGSRVTFPSLLNVGASLENCKGQYVLTKPNTSVHIVYDIDVTNRKVIGEKQITIDGQNFQAYQVSYQLNYLKSIGGMSIQSNQNLTEWIIPEIGIIERTRLGKEQHGQMEVMLNQQVVISQK